MAAIDNAIKEMRELREFDEEQRLLKSITNYNAVINYGNPLKKGERVHLTLWITLDTGEVVEVVGNFVPASVIRE